MSKKWETIQTSAYELTPEQKKLGQELLNEVVEKKPDNTKSDYRAVRSSEEITKWRESPEGKEWRKQVAERLVKEHSTKLAGLIEKKRGLLEELEETKDKVIAVFEGKLPFAFDVHIKTGTSMPAPGRWYPWEDPPADIYDEKEYEANAVTGFVSENVSPEALKARLANIFFSEGESLQRDASGKFILTAGQLESFKGSVAYEVQGKEYEISLNDKEIKILEQCIEDEKRELGLSDYEI
jgi:hypothetical protein